MAEGGPPVAAIGPDDLGLVAGPSATRHVEVAVDAAGVAGSRTWTYVVPASLSDVMAGEAVLVEWGRRRSVAIVLGDAPAPDGVTARPLGARVRADGPLLPPLALALAREITAHYLAPPALVIRAMLPPGLLEKLELVARPLDASVAAIASEPPPGTSSRDPALADLLRALAGGPRAARDLPAPDGRAALLRRLRALETAGHVGLEWTLTVAGAGPRHERVVRLTDAGREVAGGARAPDGRPVGPRQRSLLAELAPGDPGVPAPELAQRHGEGTAAALSRRGLAVLTTREVLRDSLATRPREGRRGARPAGSDLTAAQVEAVRLVRRAMTARDATPLLVDGPTGSGRTAVYAEAIAASLEAGRPALVLVPEIPLALPLVDRLRSDLGAEITILHSGLSEGERADAWRRIRAGMVEVIVGTRLAVLAPLQDVGLVIVDEEHDAAFKSDRTPRIQARDLAVTLGRLAGAAVILGSATPSVETYGLARAHTYRRATLPERPVGAAPVVDLVDLRAELAAGNRGLLSGHLASLVAALDPGVGDRAILFINRRGAASAVLCRDCGYVQACRECTRPLVYHQAGMTLRCHHCGAAAPMATRCPACASPRIRFLGGGTERLESEVRARFPMLRVARLDRDVVERRGAAQRLIDAFIGGSVDVLVGTSLVTKALDVPEVRLVGVVSADIALTLPDERAAERTYQLLAQAVGRAGRGERPGLAIIKSYQPEHPAIQAVARADPDAFYDAELEARRRFGSPPFGRLVKLTVGLEDPDAAERGAVALAEVLRARASERGSDVAVIGPAPAFIRRRSGKWRWNVVLRGSDPVALLDGGPDAPWSVDVDPESLL